MKQNNLDAAKDTRRQLQASCEERKTLQGLLFSGDASVLDRQALVMEQCDALRVTLPDGKSLLRGQYEALEKLARSNKREVEELLPRITIEGVIVVECDFSSLGVTTLKGLEGLGTLRKVNLGHNRRLSSLKGIPTQAIEAILAVACGLTGDLSELRRADRLKQLSVSTNKGLTSLKGLPMQAIERLLANQCDLTGDHLFLKEALNLSELSIEGNPRLKLDLRKLRRSVMVYR